MIGGEQLKLYPEDSPESVVKQLEAKLAEHPTGANSEGEPISMSTEVDPNQEPTLEAMRQQIQADIEQDLMARFAMQKGDKGDLGAYYWRTTNSQNIDKLIEELTEEYGPAVRKMGSRGPTPKMSAEVMLNQAVEYKLQEKLDGEGEMSEAA